MYDKVVLKDIPLDVESCYDAECIMQYGGQTLIEYFSRFWLIQIIHAYINQHHNFSESLIINKYYNTIMFFDFHTVPVITDPRCRVGERE